jgi:predicted membrane protein
METIILHAIYFVLFFAIIGFAVYKIIVLISKLFELQYVRKAKEEKFEEKFEEKTSLLPNYRIEVRELNDGNKKYIPQWFQNDKWNSFLYDYDRLEDAQKRIENDKVFLKESYDKTIVSVTYLNIE